MRRFARRRPALPGVLAVTLAALAARFVGLGVRAAHWDEARVGHRILEYAASGQWTYDPYVHGPFLFHVNRAVFGVTDPTDFTMRVVVALVGGLLPLAALLFRDRLSDLEVVAFAGLLAANPVLLYYSRFMRNDVLVAAFALVALGCLVRAYDHGAPRWLFAGSAALALAFTTKENAVMYVGIWAGAFALAVVDYRLFVRRAGDDPGGLVRDLRERYGDSARWWLPYVLLAAVEFLVILAAFYAPRPELYRALSNPLLLPGVFEQGTLGAFAEMWRVWGGSQGHPYIPYFVDYAETLRAGALTVVLLGAAGALAGRYRRGSHRVLVSFATFWAGASLLLYPLATDVQAPWAAVHTVVPLAIPAAVVLGRLGRWGVDAARDRDLATGALVAVVLVAAAGQTALAADTLVYDRPQDQTPLTQFGQPDEDLKPPMRVVERAIATNDPGAPDVLFYGQHFATFLYRLPLPWYTKSMGAESVGGTTNGSLLNPPPVVIVPADGSAVSGATAGDVEDRLEGYRRIGNYAITLTVPDSVVYAAVFVSEDALNESGASGVDAAATRRGVAGDAVRRAPGVAVDTVRGPPESGATGA